MPQRRRKQKRKSKDEEHRIFRGAEILRNQILQQIDQMAGEKEHTTTRTGLLGASPPKPSSYSSSHSRGGWHSSSSYGDLASSVGDPALLDLESSSSNDDSSTSSDNDNYEYHHEVRAIRRDRGPSGDQWSVLPEDDDVVATVPAIDLSKSYQFRSVSGPVLVVPNGREEAPENDWENTMSDAIVTPLEHHHHNNIYGTTEEAARRMVLLDDPEHFTFTNDAGDNVPVVVSPAEKRQETTCSPFSDFRHGDAEQAQRIIQELRGTGAAPMCPPSPSSPASRSEEVSRRPRQEQHSRNSPISPPLLVISSDRQTTPSKQRQSSIEQPQQLPPPPPLYTQRSSSPSPRYRQSSAPRALQAENFTHRTSGGFLSSPQRHASAPRQRRYPERKPTSSVSSSRQPEQQTSAYVPLSDTSPTNQAPKASWRTQRQEQHKIIFPGFSTSVRKSTDGMMMVADSPAARRRQRQQQRMAYGETKPHEKILVSATKSKSSSTTRSASSATSTSIQNDNGASHIRLYQQLMSDPAYVHAMQAGFLWQSLVGQHMKLPRRWWNDGTGHQRGPSLGNCPARRSSTATEQQQQPWIYLGRQSVLDNFVLQKLVKSRASGGRLLLHIVVQQRHPTTTTTVMDMALGCFHPNAKEVRDTQQALRHLESCRDVWIAVRKHTTVATANGASSHRSAESHQSLDSLLSLPDRTSRSPLGPGVRVNNNNVRAVFGEKPPLETLLLTEEELRTRLAPRIRRGESPPLAVLQEFVFA